MDDGRYKKTFFHLRSINISEIFLSLLMHHSGSKNDKVLDSYLSTAICSQISMSEQMFVIANTPTIFQIGK